MCICAPLRAYLIFLRKFLRIFSPHGGLSATGGPLPGQISPKNPCKSAKSTGFFDFFTHFSSFFHTFYRTFPPHCAGVFGQYKALHLSHTTGVLEYVADWGSCSNAVITKKNQPRQKKLIIYRIFLDSQHRPLYNVYQTL